MLNFYIWSTVFVLGCHLFIEVYEKVTKIGKEVKGTEFYYYMNYIKIHKEDFFEYRAGKFFKKIIYIFFPVINILMAVFMILLLLAGDRVIKEYADNSSLYVNEYNLCKRHVRLNYISLLYEIKKEDKINPEFEAIKEVVDNNIK